MGLRVFGRRFVDLRFKITHYKKQTTCEVSSTKHLEAPTVRPNSEIESNITTLSQQTTCHASQVYAPNENHSPKPDLLSAQLVKFAFSHLASKVPVAFLGFCCRARQQNAPPPGTYFKIGNCRVDDINPALRIIRNKP